MRVINLDETGIKLIASNKHQLYLSVNEVKNIIKKKYSLVDNQLNVNNKTLKLSDDDVKEFPSILEYLTNHFE